MLRLNVEIINENDQLGVDGAVEDGMKVEKMYLYRTLVGARQDAPKFWQGGRLGSGRRLMAACANLSKLGMDREINQPTTKMEEGLSRSKDEPFRVLEFYSGIGGMRYSIMKAGVNANIVEAFEINDIANDVYEYNFGHRPYQGNIQSLTAADLDSYCAHVWLLSPPCQPYTRQGLQKDSSDARAFSFLNILELIPKLSQAPMMLFVENVVGFETSDTHNKMIEVLAKAGYITQEFILTPLQFRVPYSRPRYFCLAKRKSTSFRNPQYNHQLLSVPSPLLGDDGDQILLDRLDEGWENLLMSCEPVERFLEFKCSDGKVERSSTDSVYSTLTERSDTMDLTIGSDGVSLDQYFVPLSLVEKLGTAMDIVYPDSRRCCCFTKSYYRYVKGTGSLLATVEPNVKGKSSSLKEQHLRYFTPREISNLHSFPREFCFPDHVSLRQRYALLGNSLSIAVVGPLLKYLIAEPS